MTITGKRVLVTGGAGFIGSHLSERLAAMGAEVRIADNFSNGRQEWVSADVECIEADLTDREAVAEAVTDDVDIVFHLAARKAVDDGDPRRQFVTNTMMTQLILERMIDINVSKLAFSSSSTVYGEAPRPTPEDYAPLEPISTYGASKLADEGMLAVYAHSHDFTVWNFRFANVVGPRLRGAVVPDFIEKLREDPDSLTILGDGHQQKSYLHIDDCIDAMCYVIHNTDSSMNTFNLGTRTTTSVNRIASIVAEEMELDPGYEYTGGAQGWKGDVPKMRLSIEKLAGLGWKPDIESDRAIRKTTRELLDEMM